VVGMDQSLLAAAWRGLDRGPSSECSILIRVPVFVLRSYRLAFPWLVTSFGAVSALVGISAVTIWGIVASFTLGQAGLAVLGFLLILLVIGAYRLWSETVVSAQELEGEIWAGEAAQEAREDQMALGAAMAHLLTMGLDIEQAQDKELARPHAEWWIEATSEFLTDAFGLGEFAVMLDSGPPLNEDPHPVDRVCGYLDHIRLLLVSRAKTLDLHPDFDAHRWVEMLSKRSREPDSESEASE
jgi:hypothetical protein